MKTKTLFAINKVEFDTSKGGNVSGGFQIVFDGEVGEIVMGLVSACAIDPNFEKVLCAVANRIITSKGVNAISKQESSIKPKYEA